MAPPPSPRTVGTPSRVEDLALQEQINLLTEQEYLKKQAIYNLQAEAELKAVNTRDRYVAASRNLLDLESQLAEELSRGADIDATNVSNLREQIKNRKELIKLLQEEAKLNAEKLDHYKKEEEKLKNREQMIEKERQMGSIILADLKKQGAEVLGLTELFSNLNQGMALGPALIFQMAAEAGKLLSTVIKGNAEFAASTGQIADRSAMFGYGTSQFGIGFEKLNKASIQLFTNMSNFSNQTREVQEQLGLAAAKMENLGVASSVTAKNFENLTLSLKLSTSEAISVNDKIAKAAIGAGIAPSKMLQEFSSNMPKLAAYGKQAVNVYIDLQKQAKSLGIEINTLNGIVSDQFDTFEGSARAAGKLNAVLGGNYLNSVEMLNATESERVLILKQAFDASGKNFDSLDKFSKKAVAATLGITDMNEANKLFSKSTSALTMDMQKQAATQEKLEAVQREAADITEKIKGAFASLLIAVRPLAEVFINLVSGFAQANDMMGGFLVPLIAIIVMYPKILGLANAIRTLGASLNAMTTANKIGLVITILATAFAMLHDTLLVPHSPILYFALLALPFIIRAIGEAAEGNEKSLTALGLAFLGIGAGVYLASKGFADFANSLKGLSGGEMVALAVGIGALTLVFIGFIVAVALLSGSGVGWIGVALILAFGAAMLMLGAGIYLAAKGFSIVAESIGTFGNSILGVLKNLNTMKAEFLIGIGVILLGLGMIGVFALSPFGIASVAFISGLGIALTLVGVGAMSSGVGLRAVSFGLTGMAAAATAFMEVFKNIPGVLTEMGTGLVNLGSSLVTMLKMFSGVGLLEMIKFGFIMAEISAGVATLGLATQLISTPSLEAMNVLLEKLQGISEWGSGASESISALAKSLVEVSLAINDIPILKTIMLKTSMDPLGAVLNASKTITKENIEPTKELIQAAKEFYIVQSEAKPMFNDPLIQTLNLVKNSINGLVSSFNTGDKGEGQKVTLIIDGKSIAAVLKPHLNTNTKSFLVGPSGA